VDELIAIAERISSLNSTVVLILIAASAYLFKAWEFTWQSAKRDELQRERLVDKDKEITYRDGLIAGLTKELATTRSIVDKMAEANLALISKTAKNG
jgi:hypothetical protein